MSEAGKKEVKISPEVSEKATRCRFTVAYKAQILAEAYQCTELGDLGELLRLTKKRVLHRIFFPTAYSA